MHPPVKRQVTIRVATRPNSRITTFGEIESIMTNSRPPFSNAFALVISIAAYQNIRKLPEVSDGAEVASVLTDPTKCGYLPDQVSRLFDAEATGLAIRRELSALAIKCNKESTVFIYFSGHGAQIQNGPRTGEYLLPVDTVHATDDDLANSGLSGLEFTKLLNDIPARKIFVVFDCCHAGGIGETKGLSLDNQVTPGMTKGFFDALASGRGRAILASCRADEVSVVLSGAKYGLFTEHLLGGLHGGAASEDGLIRVFDLFEYLQPRVTAVQPGQHPYFKFEGEENLPIALYCGGIQGKIERVCEDFMYDAYLSYSDCEPDASYVWNTLIPALRAAGLKIAVSNDCEEPGVDRVVSRERGIERSKRTIVALSEAFLEDQWTAFDETAAITLGIEEGKYRLLPVKIGPFANDRLPLRIRKLVTLDLVTDKTRGEREMQRLLQALKSPIPGRKG
jgi:hypothetical protein